MSTPACKHLRFSHKQPDSLIQTAWKRALYLIKILFETVTNIRQKYYFPCQFHYGTQQSRKPQKYFTKLERFFLEISMAEFELNLTQNECTVGSKFPPIEIAWGECWVVGVKGLVTENYTY